MSLMPQCRDRGRRRPAPTGLMQGWAKSWRFACCRSGNHVPGNAGTVDRRLLCSVITTKPATPVHRIYIPRPTPRCRHSMFLCSHNADRYGPEACHKTVNHMKIAATKRKWRRLARSGYDQYLRAADKAQAAPCAQSEQQLAAAKKNWLEYHQRFHALLNVLQNAGYFKPRPGPASWLSRLFGKTNLRH